jgi:hypothetical protein
MRRVVFLCLVFSGWGIAQGCGGVDTSGLGDGSDDGTIADGPANNPDVAQQYDSGNPNDSGQGGDGTTTEGGATDGGITDGGGSSVLLRCGDASVNDCAQCTGATQPCVYCGATDASATTGICTPMHTNCFNVIPNGFQDCPCVDASACPESYQVCTNVGRCHTCSDSFTNSGLKCENAGTCAFDSGSCL